MYFVDDEHHINYLRLVKQFEHEMSSEYRVACYVLGLSEIYRKFGGNTGENPFDWAYEEDEDGYRKQDENRKPIRSERYSWLSSGHRLMVDVAENLYNTNNPPANLGRAVNAWDETLEKVFIEAVKIRFGWLA